jgi:hypothetical protein
MSVHDWLQRSNERTTASILLVRLDCDNRFEVFEFVFLVFNISWKHGTVTAWIVIEF